MVQTLIVDDELQVRQLLAHILIKSDHECTLAPDARTARRLLEAKTFDLVLLDIIMPGESGMELLKHIRSDHPDTAVVMISTINDPTMAEETLALGAYGYVPKPFDANAVIINVSNALRRRELEIEHQSHQERLTSLVRQRTAALIESERRHQTLLGALPDPVIAYDPEGRATYVNEAFERTYGWSRDEVLGRRIDFVPEGEREKTSQGWQRIFAGEDVILETRRQTKDGQVLDVLIRGAVTRDPDGQVIESVVILKDITARKKAEENIRKEKEFRDTVLNAMSDAISIINVDDLTIAWANQAFMEEVGLTADQVIGQPCYRVTHHLSRPCQPPNDPCPLAATVKSGCRFTDEHLHFRSDGEGFYADISTNPLGDDTGRVVQVVHVSRDITERKQAEEALRRSEQRFRALFQNMGGGVAIYEAVPDDREFIFRDLNPAGEKIGQVNKADVLGRGVRELFPGVEALGLLEVLGRVNRTGRPEHHPAALYQDDRLTHWVENYVFKLPSGELVAVYEDVTEQKRAEQQLEQQFKFLETLINAAPSPIYYKDAQGHYQGCNRAFLEYIGLDRDQVVGRTVFDLSPPDLAEKYDEMDRTLMRQRGVQVFEAQVRYADGTRHDVIFHKATFLDPDGSAGGLIGIISDITERKQAEAQVQAERERFQTLTDQSPLGVILIRPDGTYAYVNPAFTQIFGYSLADVPDGRTWYRSAYPDPERRRIEISDWKKEIVTRAADGVMNRTSTVRCKDGSDKVVHFRVVGLEAGNHLVLFEDITERTGAEQALRESEDRYRTLVEALPTGFVQINDRTELIYFNDRFAEMLGYPAEVLRGRRILDFLDETNSRIVLDQVERHKKGVTEAYELAWTTKDGRQVFTMMYPNPVYDHEGNYLGSFALIVDITDRKTLESQLMQAQKLESIGQLAAGIAHEINTPTQYVTDNTRFLEEAFADLKTALDKYAAVCREVKQGAHITDLVSDLETTLEKADVEYLTEEIPRAVSQSLEGLGRISDIVRSMKEFAHPGPETKTPVDLNQAILSTITVARNEWKYVADVETDLDPGLPPVPCVAGEINQVVLNGIVNAAQAIAEVVDESSGEKGKILVSSRADGDWAEIRVTDTGPGIPPEIQDRVFDPFFTTKDPGKGTGQGLAIAFRVIREKHGGQLSLSSEPGQGTTFIIRLPLEPGTPGADS